jgi:acyl-CoA thioester hydrolase
MSLLPTYRGSVNAWECDENDHLNVRFILAKVNQGLPFALDSLGLRAAMEEQKARPRIRAQHVRFLREARMATPLTAYAGLAASVSHELTLYSELRHTQTEEVLAAVLTELDFVRADGTPRLLAVPRHAVMCDVPEHGAPRGIGADAASLRPEHGSVAELGFVEIGRGSAGPWECDAHGELEPFQYVGRISDSVVNLMAHFQTDEELSRRSRGEEGGALVELRIVHHAPLRAGDLFTIHSGIAAVGRKTQHIVHLFFDELSRACVASAEGIAVAMDLQTRRAVELPEGRRRRIEARLLRLPR